jgi:hypothetical protein
MIEASQRMLRTNSQGELGGISPTIKRYLELQIQTLKNVPDNNVFNSKVMQFFARQS